MDNTFDNRLAYILLALCSAPAVSSGGLAEKLRVSERTISNDIKQLEGELRDCASIAAARANTPCISLTSSSFGRSGPEYWRRTAASTPPPGE